MTFLESSKTTILDFYHPVSGMALRAGQLGIEIELEGENLTAFPVKGWDVHQDNSLRGPKGIGQGGVEYTTHGPIPHHLVPDAVTLLRSALTTNKVILREDSPRTSTHIHVNVQKMSWIDVFGYITLFASIEPLFLYLCGDKRDGNSFCVPAFECGDLPDWFHDVARRLDSWKPGEYTELGQRGKYASLGTFRIHDLGTLEARCFPMSVDPETINKWCTWLINIQDMVVRQDDKSFRQLIKLGIHDPMVLVRGIFGELPEVSPYLAAELVNFGSREAYELTRILKHFLTKKPEPRKEKKTKSDIINDLVNDMTIQPGWGNVPIQPLTGFATRIRRGE